MRFLPFNELLSHLSRKKKSFWVVEVNKRERGLYIKKGVKNNKKERRFKTQKKEKEEEEY